MPMRAFAKKLNRHSGHFLPKALAALNLQRNAVVKGVELSKLPDAPFLVLVGPSKLKNGRASCFSMGTSVQDLLPITHATPPPPPSDAIASPVKKNDLLAVPPQNNLEGPSYLEKIQQSFDIDLARLKASGLQEMILRSGNIARTHRMANRGSVRTMRANEGAGTGVGPKVPAVADVFATRDTVRDATPAPAPTDGALKLDIGVGTASFKLPEGENKAMPSPTPTWISCGLREFAQDFSASGMCKRGIEDKERRAPRAAEPEEVARLRSLLFPRRIMRPFIAPQQVKSKRLPEHFFNPGCTMLSFSAALRMPLEGEVEAQKGEGEARGATQRKKMLGNFRGRVAAARFFERGTPSPLPKQPHHAVPLAAMYKRQRIQKWLNDAVANGCPGHTATVRPAAYLF